MFECNKRVSIKIYGYLVASLVLIMALLTSCAISAKAGPGPATTIFAGDNLTVAESDDLSDVMPQAQPGVTLVDPYADVTNENLSLEEIKTLFGTVWVPTYLPEGLELDWTKAIEGCNIGLIYRGASSRPYILISEDVVGCYHKYPTGTVTEININGETAYLVRGNWAIIDGVTSWREDISKAVILSLGGWAFTVQAVPSSGFSDEELIKVASSLVEY